jgi:hypothetical protein
MIRLIRLVILGFAPSLLSATGNAPAILPPELGARHVAFFNAMEPEGVVNHVPNAAAAAWLEAHVDRKSVV